MVHGWRTWNSAASFRGRGVGAKVRRWWWGVNGWGVPSASGMGSGVAASVKKTMGVDLSSGRVARQAAEFYEGEFGSAMMD